MNLNKVEWVIIKGKFSDSLLQNLQLIMAGIFDRELEYLQPNAETSPKTSVFGNLPTPLSDYLSSEKRASIFSNLTLIVEDDNVEDKASVAISALKFLDKSQISCQYYSPKAHQSLKVVEYVRSNYQVISCVIHSDCFNF